MTHAVSAIPEGYEQMEKPGDGETATASSPEATRAAPARRTRENTKKAAILAMLRRPKGGTIERMAAATDSQAHRVRGFISRALKKTTGRKVSSAEENGRRVYRVA